MNSLFAISVYAVLGYSILGLRVPGHTLIISYLPTVLYAVIICLGFKELAAARHYSDIIKKPAVTLAITAYVIICMIMAAQIPLNLFLADSITSVIGNIIVWLLPVVAVFGLKEENWNTIRKAACWQSAVGCLVLLLAMPAIRQEVLQSNPLHERLSVFELGGGVLVQSGQLTYACTFLLLSFQGLSSIWRLTALATAGLTAWIALIGQFRSGILPVFLAAAIGLGYIPLRVQATSVLQRSRKMITPLLFVMLVVAAAAFTTSLYTNLSDWYGVALDYVAAIQRRGIAFSDSGYASDSGLQSSIDLRIEESRQALSEQNAVQLLLGKGMGATWSGGTIYDERRNMLHFGIGHLLLHGGIPLTVFVLIFPVGTAIYPMLRSRSQIVLACAGVVCVALVQSFAYNLFVPNLYYLMLLLCAGGCLLHFRRKASPPQ